MHQSLKQHSTLADSRDSHTNNIYVYTVYLITPLHITISFKGVLYACRVSHSGRVCGAWPPSPVFRTEAPAPWSRCSTPARRSSTFASRGRQCSTVKIRALLSCISYLQNKTTVEIKTRQWRRCYYKSLRALMEPVLHRSGDSQMCSHMICPEDLNSIWIKASSTHQIGFWFKIHRGNVILSSKGRTGPPWRAALIIKVTSLSRSSRERSYLWSVLCKNPYKLVGVRLAAFGQQPRAQQLRLLLHLEKSWRHSVNRQQKA